MAIYKIFSRFFSRKHDAELTQLALSTKDMVHSDTKMRNSRKGERGNVFFTLFGAVSIVGVLGAGVMSTMRGPLSTMVEVNRMEEAKAEMRVGARLILTKSTDDDGDGYTEALAPTAAAGIPLTVSAEKTDPWGRPYLYCSWNHGPPGDDGAGGNRLAGVESIRDVAMAIISSGPDRTFQTRCDAATDTDGENYIVNIATGNSVPVGTNGAGDDLMEVLTYDDAVVGSGGLWSVDAQDEASIDKALDVEGGANFAGQLRFDNTAVSGAGLVIPTDASLINSDCDGDDAANDGIVRINTTTTPNTLELCDGGNAWYPVNEAFNEWVDDGSDNISHNTGNVSTTQTLTGGTVVSTADTNVGGDLNATGDVGGATATITGAVSGGSFTTTGTLNAGTSTLGATTASTLTSNGTLTVAGVADINNNLEVSGTSTLDGNVTAGTDLIVNGNTNLGDAVTDTVTIAGPTTVGGTLGVTGTSTLAAVTATDIDSSTLDTTGNVTVGGTLGGASGGDLEMTAGIKLGNSASCSSSDEGTIRYSGSKVQYCTGTSWKGFTIDMIRDIDNVDISSDPTDKFLLIWDDPSKTWKAVDPGTLEVADADASDESLKLEDADNDTKVQVEESSDEDMIRFDTAGTERMVIDETGKVGIGTDSPNQSLEILSTFPVVRLTDSNAALSDNGLATYLEFNGNDGRAGYVGIGSATSNNMILNADTGSVMLRTNGGGNLYLTQGGNVGIGNATPAATSILDLTSTTKGFLSPRMTTVQRDAISSPATGLQIYNTDEQMPQFWNGTKWEFAGGAGGGLSCTEGQVMKYDATGSTWICADDAGAGSTVEVGDTANYNLIFTPGTPGWAQNGNSLTISGAGRVGLTALDSTTVAFVDASNDELRTYSWDGTDWSQVGAGLSISSLDYPRLTTLDSTTVAMYFWVGSNKRIGTYSWNGSTWSQVGNLRSVGSIAGTITALDSTTVAFATRSATSLATYSWDGTNWNLVGNVLSSASLPDGLRAITALDSTTIAITSVDDDDIRTYSWDGTDWSQVGSALGIEDSFHYTEALSATEVVVGYSNRSELRNYSWDGSNWSHTGTFALPTVGGSGFPQVGLTHLGSGSIAFVESINDELRTYVGTGAASIQDSDASGTLGALLSAGVGFSVSGTTSNNGAYSSAAVVDADTIEVAQAVTTEGPVAATITITGTLPEGPLIGSAGKLIDADEDTQIQVEESADDDTIRFDTAGSERMLIDPSGNVGIGEASPTSPLDVAGDANVTGLLLDSVTGAAVPTGIGVADTTWSTGSGDDIYRDVGDVGIGTTSPNSKLHVAGAIQIANDSGTCNSTKAGAIRYNSSVMEFCEGAAWTEIGGVLESLREIGNVNISSDPAADSILVWNDTTKQWNAAAAGDDLGAGGTTTGNIVMNNASPTLFFQDTDHSSGMIHMNSHFMQFLTAGTNSTSWAINGSNWPMTINMTNDAITIGGDMTFAEGTLFPRYMTLQAQDGTNEGGEIQLRGAGSYGDVQIDNYQGNVRIHTLATGKQFQVLGGDGVEATALELNGVTGAAAPTGGAGSSWLPNGSDIYRNTGNVGIGTDTPGQKLHVAGNVLATAYFHSSDERLKDNIQTSDGLDLISKMRGVTFDWKSDGSASAGIIAQEVEKVMPSAVKTGDDGIKSVEYDQFIAPLIEAVKELKAENEALRARIETLEEGK